MIQDVGAVALNVGRASCDDFAQVVLSEDFHGEVVLEDVDVGVVLNSLHERLLNFVSGVVGVVQDAELAVSALAMQVEVAVGVLVEVHAPLNELSDLPRSLGHHLFHGLGVAEPVAGHHGVVDVLVEVIHQQVGHTGHTALSQVGVSLVESAFANQRH